MRWSDLMLGDSLNILQGNWPAAGHKSTFFSGPGRAVFFLRLIFEALHARLGVILSHYSLAHASSRDIWLLLNCTAIECKFHGYFLGNISFVRPCRQLFHVQASTV